MSAPFYEVGDCDAIYVAQALGMNAGWRQTYFDHPGYPYIVLISATIRLLHLLGAVPTSDISGVLHFPGFGVAMTSVVASTRLLSPLIASAVLIVFASILKRMRVEPLLLWPAVIMFAFTEGMGLQSFTLRPELLSMLCLLGLFRLLLEKTWWADLGAGALCMLSLWVKAQNIVLLPALPVLAGLARRQALIEEHSHRESERYAIAFGVVGCMGYLVFLKEFTVQAMASFRLYSLLIPLLPLVIALKAWIARDRRLWLSVVMLAAGSGLCYLALLISPLWMGFAPLSPMNLSKIFNFYDHMRSFSPITSRIDFASTLQQLLTNLWHSTLQKITPRTWLSDPISLVYIGVGAGCVARIRRKSTQAVMPIALLTFALILEAVYRLRNVSSSLATYTTYYRIYVEPWSIFAAVIAIGAVPMAWRKRLMALSCIAFALLSAYSTAEKTRTGLFFGLWTRQTPAHYCSLFPSYTPMLRSILGPPVTCLARIK